MNTTNEGELAHLQAWELLPWIVNGRASEAEHGLVDVHLLDCERCQAELAIQRKLFDAMVSRDDAGSDVEQGLDRLWQRFDETEQRADMRPHASAPPRRWMSAVACGLAAVVLLETGALATLGVQRGGNLSAIYRTLSQPSSGAGRATIRLVVDPAMTVGRLQALLAPLKLEIISGPSENGVYSLAPMSGRADVAAQVATLRATSGIRFAEPIGEAGG